MQFANRSKHLGIYLFCLIFFLFADLYSSPALGRNKLKVGVSDNSPPISFKEPDETVFKGFSVDLAKLLASSIGLDAEIHAMNHSGLIPALDSGRVDCVIGLLDDSYSSTNTIKTSLQAERGYFVNSRIFESFSNNNFLEYTVVIERGRTLSWHSPRKDKMTYIETDSQEEALRLLDSGSAQIYISRDSGATKQFIQKMGLGNIRQVGMPIEIVPLVIAVHREDPELLTSLSIAYGKILEDGRYHKIFYKWLGNDLKVIMTRYKKHLTGTIIVIVLAALMFVIRNYILKRKVKKISKDLQFSEQKYKDLIESSPDMIHLINSEGQIKLVNKIALRCLRYSRLELLSSNLLHLVPPDQQMDMKGFIDSVFQENYSTREFTLISKDGKKVWVEMVACVVKWHNASENLACCFSRDLAERKSLEEELVRSDRLAIIGRMASGIAHEINNPLSIILSNVDDMLNYELNTRDSNESLKSIERNAQRAAKIIKDLLTFTRPEPLRVSSVELSHVIDNAMLFLKQRLKQKNISIVKRCADGLIFTGSENLIQQLLINLILNSIQAIKDEGRIMINAELKMNGGGNIVAIEIEDNGVGIERDDFEKIFDPFFTSRKEDGFGLGLFLSKIIVEKHGGRITTDSTCGEGTVMKVELPVDRGPMSTDHESREGRGV